MLAAAGCLVVAVFVFLVFLRRDDGNGDALPAPPDYSLVSNWAALPWIVDQADVIPAGCGMDLQSLAQVDAFYVHPTTHFSAGWNAPIDNLATNLVTDWGPMTQQASAFNAAARVFAPRYRQVSQTGQGSKADWNNRADGADAGRVQKAMDLAFSDIEHAFEHYLRHYNDGRALVLAAHSQGTMHAKRLLAGLAQRDAGITSRLVAAYLVGNTVEEDELAPIPVCGSETQTGCFVAWNTVVEGADTAHWDEKLRFGARAACVNPLTWRNDSDRAPREMHRGGMGLSGHLFLTDFDAGVIGARCGEKGNLHVDDPTLAGARGWYLQARQTEVV